MARDKWMKIRRRLNGNYQLNEDWEKGIQFFKSRIEERYFKPVDEIIKTKNFKGEGFSIVTVQCALIETFAAFRKGAIHNPRYQEGIDPNYQYGNSEELFIEFLNNQSIFENNFYVYENGRKKKDKPFRAKDFYANVRCSLVHETRTKKNWVIRVKKKYSNNKFLDQKGNDKIIYRTNLQRQLKTYLTTYIDELLNPQNSD